MRESKSMKWIAVFFGLVALVAGAWYVTLTGGHDTGDATIERSTLPEGALVSVILPASFSEREKIGARAYEASCAVCHGINARGKDGVAPPLVHKIYEPGHHGDMAFVLAAQNGVRAHHWKFGNMPPVEGITRADVLNIVAYVRVLQRENGID